MAIQENKFTRREFIEAVVKGGASLAAAAVELTACLPPSPGTAPATAPAAAPAGLPKVSEVIPAVATTATEVKPKSEVAIYTVFHPEKVWDLGALRSAEAPTYEDTLKRHGLSGTDVQQVRQPNVSWEPALHVVELTKENYGKKTIPLLPGYVYTVALQDGSVQVLWGGDPEIKTADVQWGFSARWVPRYENSEGNWLNLNDTRELAVREYRFGRYLRSRDMQGVRPDVPYFGRIGPYYTGTGNLDVQGWIPPSLNSTVPRNYLDACAMLGGLCNPDEWAQGEQASGGYLNWSWKYSKKVPGSADYCPPSDLCWQTAYIPEGNGYVEIWLSKGTTGPNGKPVENAGPHKFFAQERSILADGFHNVDEFSYHADPSR